MQNYNKLDAAAKLFPAVTSKHNSSVFRISVVLDQAVDARILQLAVNMIYERYSLFFLRLRRGVFWNYFDTNYSHFIVGEENATPCSSVFENDSNGYIMRVLYYKNRISIETFHALTDGTGALAFMKSLLYYYLTIQNGEIDAQGKILLFDELPDRDDEDSFSKHFGARRARRARAQQRKAQKGADNAFRMRGKRFRKGGHSAVTGVVSVQAVKAASRAHNCTITAFLIALTMQAIYQEKQKNAKDKRPIVVAMPVNLRNLFDSKTLKNFFGVVNISFKMNDDTRFDDLVQSVTQQMQVAGDARYLEHETGKNVKLSNNIFARHTPLLVKKMVMPIGFAFMGELKKTISLSNVGRIDFPDGMKPYIKQVEVLFYPTVKSPMNCAVCSFEDNLSINFTRAISDASVLQNFFKTLAAQTGAQVMVYSNMWGEANEQV